MFLRSALGENGDACDVSALGAPAAFNAVTFLVYVLENLTCRKQRQVAYHQELPTCAHIVSFRLEC